MISCSNISKHHRSHETGKFQLNQPKYSLDHDDLFCKYCHAEKLNKISLVQHEIRCAKNPNRIPCYLSSAGHVGWNKGLTKYTDSRVAKYSKTISESVSSRIPHTSLSDELDDDGKLYRNYQGRRSANKSAKHKFLLSYDEFCQLLKEAGIKSSDLGYNGNNYDLARYGDQGDYTYGNCRFITHKENLDERMYNGLTEKERRIQREAAAREKAKRKLEHLEARRKFLEEAEAKKNPAHSGENSPSYGSHWITNGSINRKWYPDKEPMPEGWRLGRIVNI